MAFSYFTMSELRLLPDMDDTGKYTEARCTAAAEWIEARIENTVGTSFVAREVTETLDGDSQDCHGGILLGTPYVLEVTAITANGVAFDAGDLAEVSVRAGIMYRRAAGTYSGYTPWDLGTRNIVVTYDSGYSATPPLDIKDAALQGARYRALRTATAATISDRATSFTNDLGNVQLSVAGKDRPTGLPEIDVVLIDWRDKLDLYGFSA